MLFKRTISRVLCFIMLLGLFAYAAGAGKTFSDVSPGSWYYDAVTQMSSSGVLGGYPDNTFRPSKTVTGAEFVAITARQAGLENSTSSSPHWASGYLDAALNSGWYDWDELPPTGEKYDQPIPRQLAVKILMKALLPDAHGSYDTEASKISDLSSLDGRYYDPVFAAYANGIVAGDASTGNFRPKDGLSRAEACMLIQRAASKSGAAPVAPLTPEPPETQSVVRGGISENGRLQVTGTQLCNSKGEPVILRGMSTHGMQWYGGFASSGAIKTTAEYGANLFRIAMYTSEGGYLSNPEQIKKQVFAAVDAAAANDMYAIIDWHILSDGDPMSHVNEAKAFFNEASSRYKNSPAVLYEICNEPNGNVTWAGNIKPYAEQIVSVIRQNDPFGVILIGSGTWSQDILDPASDPVTGTNLMYTCHFYAGTHGSWLRERIDAAIQKGIPVFISEWGTSAADGNGGVFLGESAKWLEFLNARNISWANWSLCDKNESSSALLPGASRNGGWTQENLSESGRFVFQHFSH